MGAVADLTVTITVMDDDGNVMTLPRVERRWATTGGEKYEAVTLPTGAFTALSPPRKAALLLLVPPRSATSWTLKGAEADTGIALIGDTNFGLPLLLPLGTSPTLGIQNEGATCAAQALWVTSLVQPEGIADTFTRADSSALGTTETGDKTWQVTEGHTWGIASGRARYQAGAGNTIATVEAWADFEMEVTLATITGSLDGICLRFSGDEFTSGWIFAVDDPAFYNLIRIDSGAAVEYFPSVIAPQNGDQIRIRAEGESIVCYVNDVEAVSVENSWQETEVNVGLAERSGGLAASRWDDFAVAPVT